MASPNTGIQLCVQNDVELAVGGVAVLAQLLDKNGDGIADSDLVASIIGRASSYVIAGIGAAAVPGSLSSPYPDILVYTAANVAAYYSWTMGSSEIVIPDGAKMLMDAADSTIAKIRNREISLGANTAPASALEVKQIDTDNGGTLGRLTRDSIKGFW